MRRTERNSECAQVNSSTMDQRKFLAKDSERYTERSARKGYRDRDQGHTKIHTNMGRAT